MNKPREFLIWSYEHNAWWRPGSFGYTKDPKEAGRYTETEARRICADANRYSPEINERMIHFSDVAGFLDEL